MTAPNWFRRQVLLNALSTGLGNGWAMVVTLASLPLLLRGMGATAFGIWVLVQTFSAVTGWFSLADLGLVTAATRAIATKASLNDQPGVGSVVSSALTSFAALGILCAGALALLGPPLLPDVFKAPSPLREGLRLAILLFSAQVLMDILTEGSEACLEGLQRVDLSRAVDAIRRTTVAIATVVVAQVNGRLAPVAAASLAASAIGTLAGTLILARTVPRGFGRPSRSQMRQLIAYARTVAVLQPLGVLRRTMDRLIVGAVLGPQAVSLVEIATQIQNGADAVLSATTYSVIPSAAWLDARQDREKLRELLHRGTKYAVLATFPVAAGAAMLAGPLVRLWVGPSFAAAGGLATVALLSVMAAAPLQVGVNLLLGAGRAAAVVRPSVVAIAVNLALSLVLVHVTGIVGVFQATLVASAVLAPLLLQAILRAVDSTIGEFLRDGVVPVFVPLAGLVLASGIVIALPLADLPTLLIGALVGGVTYILVAARWSVDRDELEELRTLARRDRS